MAFELRRVSHRFVRISEGFSEGVELKWRSRTLQQMSAPESRKFRVVSTVMSLDSDFQNLLRFSLKILICSKIIFVPVSVSLFDDARWKSPHVRSVYYWRLSSESKTISSKFLADILHNKWDPFNNESLTYRTIKKEDFHWIRFVQVLPEVIHFISDIWTSL